MTKLNPFRAHPVKQSKMVDLFNPSVQTADTSLAIYFQCMATGWGFKRGFDVGTQRVKTPLYKQTHLRGSGSAEQSQPWSSVHPCSNSKNFHLLEFTRITRDVLGSVKLLCNLLSDQISCSTYQRVLKENRFRSSASAQFKCNEKCGMITKVLMFLHTHLPAVYKMYFLLYKHVCRFSCRV